MGQAILSAIYKAPKVSDPEVTALYPEKIIACNQDEVSAQKVTDLIKELGESPNGIIVESTYSKNREVVEQSEVLLLAVKPYVAAEVMDEVKDLLPKKLLMSVVAGLTIEQLEEYTPTATRVMPNIAAKYGCGCAAVAHAKGVSKDQKRLVKELLDQVGKCVEIPERNMDAMTSLVGSGPAFVLLILEAMVEGGVKMGIPFKESLEAATQVLGGTAEMVSKSGLHPAVLKHQICTPGGTTIAGLCTMEENGVRSGIVKGLEEAKKKSEEMSRK